MSDPTDEIVDAAVALAEAIMRATRRETEPTAPTMLLSIDETMRQLDVSRGTVYRLLADGTLAGVHIGSRHLVVRASVDAIAKG